MARPAALAALVMGLSGCAGAGASSGASPPATGTASRALAASPRHAGHREHARRHRRRHRRRAWSGPAGSGALAYSTASNQVVQAQPPAGSCHAVGSGSYERPDPRCTPGALNPAVRPSTIDQTICVPGWTKSVRPPESVTEAEKAASMAAYGDSGPMADYEYDHLVPLELGGATNDPRNLWPEPGATPNAKDEVEGRLRRAVCDGQMTLGRAQLMIARNWTSAGGGRGAGTAPESAPAAAPEPAPVSRGSRARCSATASYSSRYDDYDVYVHSAQPDQTVTVSDSLGHSSSWHTDASGYADVYFKSGGYAPGRRISVRVGAATCATTL